jgi:hypothetical protein
MKQEHLDGLNLIGVALTIFGVGFIVPLAWQKAVMFISFIIIFCIANGVTWGFIKIKK